MSRDKHSIYNKVYKAIKYLDQRFQEQPSLDDVAKHVHVSPFHFQKLFIEWAGVSPKKYVQFLSVSHAKKVLRESKKTLYNTALETGFSSSSRLHDLFINVEGMTPKEYKNGGSNLLLNYGFSGTPFGDVIVASTERGVCFLSFCERKKEGLSELKEQFPNAQYKEKADKLQQRALAIFQRDWAEISTVKLHLKGTDFQLKVWEALLRIPVGQLQSYGDVAQHIGKPRANRAVGSAVGKNPIAFLIPCHRVIQSSGQLGGYRWNTARKKSMIGWEAAYCHGANLATEKRKNE